MKVWDSKSGNPEKVDTGDTLIAKANELHLQGKFAEAELIYGQLLEQNYNNLGLLATLGSLYVQNQQWGLGIHFLQYAMDGGLKEPDAYTNLAMAYQRSGQYDKARVWYEKSIEGESTPEALTNYSGMFIESGDAEKCIAMCEKAIKDNPGIAMAHWNMALALLGEGRWDRAWEEHEWGIGLKGLREDRDVLGVPRWDGTPGKTVLVYGEQGLGDEIMFASMLPDLLKTNTVVLECQSRLETLFRTAFPQIEAVYGTRWDEDISWGANHKVDARIAIGSLGKFYRRSRDAFPGTAYLKADPLPKGEKFRVGISWQGGGQKLGRVQKRSVPLPWWKSILNVPNVEFVSLQYTDCKEELDVMEALGYDIKRMDEYAKAQDYYETARLIASCDLVISVCTSAVHLAGALGVPCYVICPKHPAWRYQNSGGMPFYKSVRLYRSPDAKQDGWIPVLAKIGLDLDELVSGKKLQVAA